MHATYLTELLRRLSTILGSEAMPTLSYEQIGASGGQVVKDVRDITRVRASLGVVIAA